MADNAKMHFNIGLILATLEDHERAVRKKTELDWRTMWNLTLVRTKIAAYRTAIAMDQFFAVAYFQMGVSHFILNDMEAARQDFDQAFQVWMDDLRDIDTEYAQWMGYRNCVETRLSTTSNSAYRSDYTRARPCSTAAFASFTWVESMPASQTSTTHKSPKWPRNTILLTKQCATAAVDTLFIQSLPECFIDRRKHDYGNWGAWTCLQLRINWIFLNLWAAASSATIPFFYPSLILTTSSNHVGRVPAVGQERLPHRTNTDIDRPCRSSSSRARPNNADEKTQMSLYTLVSRNGQTLPTPPHHRFHRVYGTGQMVDV